MKEIPQWLIPLLRLLRVLLDYVSDVLYHFLHSSHTPLPPISNPLLLEPATLLANKIRQRKVSSHEVVTAFIQRIQEVNPILNCVVDNRFEAALNEASEIDALLSSSSDEQLTHLFQEKPFLGVPFTTKDCFAVTGQSWTAGLLARGGVKATFDAPTVAAMRSAGAIPLGVTNVSELCMWMESSNNVYGRTNNPYHTGRTVGGSSGGEGCVVSSAGSPWGIGSDVGGSIRMPSFFNGVFGHKPSSGIVDNGGQLPLAHGEVKKFLTTGPICRHAMDLAPMLALLAGKHKDILELDQEVQLDRVKVFYMEDDGGFPLTSRVHPDLRQAQTEFIQRFASKHKVKPVKVNISGLFHSLAIWSHGMASAKDAPSFSQELVQCEGEISPWFEFVKWCFGQSDHTLPALGLAISEKFIDTNSEEHQHFLRLAEDTRMELQQLLGQDGVLVYPSHSTPAPYHTQPLVKTFNFPYTAIFNILGNPVTQIPLGLGSWGVPLGVQVVAGKHMDRLTIAMAIEAEAIAGGWVPPSTSI